MLGRAKGIFVNINREKISTCKKPQLDLNHSSSRLSKRETSSFKILKAKNTERRDNKFLNLNSDDDGSDSENDHSTTEDKIKQDFAKFVQPLKDDDMDFDEPMQL